MKNKRNALGRGLSAILRNPKTDIIENRDDEKNLVSTINNISIKDIQINPFQPRTEFDEEKLFELSESIKELGIIQPITVRKLGYNKYQLISGERRLRASKVLNLKTIPSYIRIANDEQMLEMALVENIQRDNLNPIDIALSFQRLIKECNLTQEECGNKLGKQRSTITNFLRLLKLPSKIQEGLKQAFDAKCGTGEFDKANEKHKFFEYKSKEETDKRLVSNFFEWYSLNKEKLRKPLFDKEIVGFGELFRQLSFADIGTSTIQSRAVAGFANNTVIFCMPGSTGACKTAWDGIICEQLDSRYGPCNFVELLEM